MAQAEIEHGVRYAENEHEFRKRRVPGLGAKNAKRDSSRYVIAEVVGFPGWPRAGHPRLCFAPAWSTSGMPGQGRASRGANGRYPFFRYTSSDSVLADALDGRSFSQFAITCLALIGPSQSKAKEVVKNRMWPPGRVLSVRRFATSRSVSAAVGVVLLAAELAEVEQRHDVEDSAAASR